MNRLLFIFIFIQILVTAFSTKWIVDSIEKHSVHPAYGNYKKVSSEGLKCQPWDDCR